VALAVLVYLLLLLELPQCMLVGVEVVEMLVVVEEMVVEMVVQMVMLVK
jgi:hypothetical protein